MRYCDYYKQCIIQRIPLDNFQTLTGPNLFCSHGYFIFNRDRFSVCLRAHAIDENRIHCTWIWDWSDYTYDCTIACTNYYSRSFIPGMQLSELLAITFVIDCVRVSSCSLRGWSGVGNYQDKVCSTWIIVYLYSFRCESKFCICDRNPDRDLIWRIQLHSGCRFPVSYAPGCGFMLQWRNLCGGQYYRRVLLSMPPWIWTWVSHKYAKISREYKY